MSNMIKPFIAFIWSIAILIVLDICLIEIHYLYAIIYFPSAITLLLSTVNFVPAGSSIITRASPAGILNTPPDDTFLATYSLLIISKRSTLPFAEYFTDLFFHEDCSTNKQDRGARRRSLSHYSLIEVYLRHWSSLL